MRCQLRILICVLGCYAWCWADSLSCDLTAYHGQPGLRAQVAGEALQLSWDGARGQELRASFGIENGTPVVRELAVRKRGGQWQILGRSLTPEFDTVSGKRRIGTDQLAPLRQLGITDPQVLAAKKWNAFWDAPLLLPGLGGRNEDLPRKPEEIHRGVASFHANSCAVKTDGARLEVSFPGLSMGIFSGRLQFTVYKGTNLLRQEAIAKTDEPDVAYKYIGGLKGFRIGEAKRVVWRDVARGWQKYEFGGSPNQGPVALVARNRLGIVETAGGSVAFFPAPHKFFWAREIERNLGYVYYRKDNEESFGIGVRQPERDDFYRPYGFTDQVWNRRVGQSRDFRNNFALYNAPPGTWQRMAVYFYLSPDAPPATQEAVMAFTHDDQFKPLPGYQVAASHFHTHLNEEITDAGTLDWVPAWIPTFRALGINILMMSDFHSDSHPADPGPLRLAEQKVYFDASRRHSDHGFLILPAEEPNRYLRAHYTTAFSRPVYWTMVRGEGQPLVETVPEYGKVYHVGSLADEMEMLRLENGYVWLAHPRTKGSDGYPDAIKDSIQLKSDRYLGASWESLPVDLSQARLCEERCFGVMDDMNNWVGPKYLIAEGDTYTKYPDDETYPALGVNYIKLDRVPRFDEDWSPILKAMRAGDYFVTTGELLIKRFALEGSGTKRAVVADLEWTYPMEFVEVVWGDGQKTGRQIIPATDLPPFGTHTFRIPVDLSGKKWIRFAAWDSAGDGAFAQPVHVTP
jgi:hypothetical protein